MPPSAALPQDAAAAVADPGAGDPSLSDAGLTKTGDAAATPMDAAADTGGPKRRKPGKPQTEEEQLQRNAGRRRKWAETRVPRQPRRSFTLRQERLIDAYLRLGSVSAAAREAGYTTTSNIGGSFKRFLHRPDVAAIIEARQAEMRRRSEVTMERVIGELAKLAFADPRDLFTPDGKLKSLHELDDASAASISALEVLAVAGGRRTTTARSRTAGGKAAPPAADAGATDAGTAGADGEAADGSVENSGDVVLELRKIKRWDKTKALELLGRYLGLFKDRLELGVSADLAGAIEAARKRSHTLAAPDAAKVIEATVAAGRAVEDKVLDGAVVDETEAEEAPLAEDA